MGWHKSINMGTFRDRLLAEKTELDERREKLVTFLESEKVNDIEPLQISLLNIQSQAMLTYSQVLTERISWLAQPV
jgi:hypothetical protein